jgi:uroporphyrinogen III methyltransferase/synthase
MGDVDGTKVLVAGAQAARDVLPLRLRQKGAHVDVVSVYRTVMPRSKGNVGDLENADMITFASASSVRNFISMAGDCAQGLLDSMYTVAIGPVTASCLEEMGLEPDLVAQEYTVAGMVEAITEFFANKGTVQ